MSIKVSFDIFKLAQVFTISRGSRTEAEVLTVKITKNGVEQGVVSPARSKYPTKPELLHEIGLKAGFWKDIYVVLSDFDKSTGKQITVQIYINPLVRIVWISAFIMVIGGIFSLCDPFRGDNSRDHLKEA